MYIKEQKILHQESAKGKIFNLKNAINQEKTIFGE
ncbi:MAG: hypothetical protein CM1200mP30_09370 [Pseudomonadota bacterium]|nr:MAG: hypothetical protein CM1200mP30_09370 [Pseudomonadota bacterium]